jgi:predicted metalloprotease with PDZ domain
MNVVATLLCAQFVGAVGGGLSDGPAYHLRYDAPGDSLVHISITLPAAAPGPVTLVIPRAVPMGYASVPYDRYVVGVRARSDHGTSLEVRRAEGPRWEVGAERETVRGIDYAVNVARMEREILSASDASKLRTEYVGLLGYSVFGYVEGLQDTPLTLTIEGPDGWSVFTTLAPEAWDGTPGAVTASARRFYDLADAQVMMGPELRVRRLDAPLPLYLAVYAEAPVELDVVGGLAEEAMRRVVDYFGSKPMAHYTVYQEYLRPVSPDHEYGFSMEHMESGTFFLGVDRAVTAATEASVRERTLFNFMHHFAHSWIPKRSYGAGYFPFQWELAPIIETIWLSEGWARYAAIEMAADALPGAEGVAYRARVLQGFRDDLRAMPPFLNAMTLVELSRTGSTAYGDDFRVGRSLFMRGALMAADMDARIREASGGEKRFRDALRYLVGWSIGSGRAFRVDELPGLIEAATGVEVGDVLRGWLAARVRRAGFDRGRGHPTQLVTTSSSSFSAGRVSHNFSAHDPIHRPEPVEPPLARQRDRPESLRGLGPE